MGQSQRATRSCTSLVRTAIIAATFGGPCQRAGHASTAWVPWPLRRAVVGPTGSAADGRPDILAAPGT
jgi:hypothetical protein